MRADNKMKTSVIFFLNIERVYRVLTNQLTYYRTQTHAKRNPVSVSNSQTTDPYRNSRDIIGIYIRIALTLPSSKEDTVQPGTFGIVASPHVSASCN